MPNIHVNEDGSVTILPVDPESLSGGVANSDAPVSDVIGDLDIASNTPRTVSMPEPETFADTADAVN